MAKATTRKKTKTSGRNSGGGKRTGPAGKSVSSHRKAQPARTKKTGAKPAKKTSKVKKATQKAASRPAARKTTSKKIKSKPAAKKTSRRTTSKKAATKQTSRAQSATRAAKTVASKKAPAVMKAAKTAPTAAGTKKKAAPPAAPPANAPAKRGAAKGHETAKPPEVPKVPLPTVEEAMAQLPYHEGQFVVHPKYGLGKVDRITERKLSTRTVPCLEISFSYQEMRLTIPVDQVERSGLRRPISRREIDEVFKALKGRATFDAKRRSAKRVVDYRKRLNMGDPISLAEAIRDLGRLSLKKSLSYEERKILSTALRILSREVALARGREPDDVREEIEKIVYR